MKILAKTAFSAGMMSLALLSWSATASASDIIEEAAVPEVVIAPQAANNWYLRGDLGYNVSSATGLEVRDSVDAIIARGFDFDKGFTPSIGVGYQFTDYLRADVTASYARQDIDGLDAKARTWDMMANAYVDMGNFVGFTPYLGAGLGFANVRYSIDSDQGDYKSDDYRFAWALMAGVGIDLTQNVKLDLGYRYGVVNGGDIAGDALNLSDKDIKSHQLRAGIRVAAW